MLFLIYAMEIPNMNPLFLTRGLGGLLREAVKFVISFYRKNELVVETKGRLSEWDAEFKTTGEPC